MNVHFSYRVSKTPDIEKEINHNINKLEKRLQAFRPELIHLKGNIEKNSAREGMIASLNLRLPSGQMAAHESAATATAALKAGFSDLLQQLNRHKDLLRSSHKWMRRGAQETRRTLQVPFEETLAAVHPLTASSDDIRSYVNANLARLDRFVERELYFREASGQIYPHSLDKEEIIDEAIARALGDGAEKPERLAVEPWLYHLALRVIQEAGSDGNGVAAELHLSDSAWKRNVQASDEPRLQYHQPDESLTGENVIPDTHMATPEEIAYCDEVLALMQFALASVKLVDRNAFLLHVIEGFSADEISAITDRSLDSVQSSLVVARQHLMSSPPAPGALKSKLLQRTGTG